MTGERLWRAGRCVEAGLVVVLVLGAAAVAAQDYRFEIPEAEVTVAVWADGSARLRYRIQFVCQPGAHPIDVVDIGMPNLGPHEPGAAAIDGRPLPAQDVRISTYLKPRGCGYEIDLGTHAIQPGRSGVLEFSAHENGMVWQDTTRPDQVSVRFSPTWFGAAYVVGQTQLTMRVILPVPATEYPEVKDRILWQRQGQEFDVKGVMEGENFVSVGWARSVSLTGPVEVGVSFPKAYVTRVRSDSLWRVLRRWFEGSPVRPVSGAVLALALMVVFLHVTRMTGWTLLLLLEAALIGGMMASPTCHLVMLVALPALCVVLLPLRRRPRRHYFPAEVCVEGGGLKRGLTAVESAVVLEKPFSQVLTMVIYGLLRKGALEVAAATPLRLAPLARREGLRTWCSQEGTPLNLHDYELAFMEAFRRHDFGPIEQMDLREPFDQLIRETARRMRGFSFDLTRDYCRFRVDSAWRRVRQETGFEARCRNADENLDWLMLDDGWGRGLDEMGMGRDYRPRWWHHHGGRTAPAPVTIGGAGAGMPRNTPNTTFADVTNSLCSRLEGLCSRSVAGMDCLKPRGLDLSSVDRFTGEFLKSLAENAVEGRGGGGFGGGCACACAGCACACACAGGGR